MLDLVWAYALFGLAIVPITVYFNQFLFFMLAFYVSVRKFYKKANEPLEYLPGVSIIKPLMGVDAYLSENIVSHFELQYPNFEIIFCIEDPNDPAVELVESIFRKYPHVDAHLIIGGNGNIINPLVNNLLPAYESARYDLVWLTTSRIRVTTDIMIDMVRRSEDPRVALVHQIPFFCDRRGFMNAIEKVSFGCSLGRSAIALNQLGMLCFTGMSYIVRKSILDRYGGFARLGKFLAEDYFCSKVLFDNGYKIEISAYPAQQNAADARVSAYISRLVRWLRLRLNMVTVVAAFFEPMIECVNLGFLIALSLRYFFGFAVLTTMAVHVSIWMLLDYLLLRCIQNGPLPFSFVTFIFAWWARELLTYVIYVKAVLHPRTVKWGVNTYRLSFGGHTEILRGHNGGVSTTGEGTKRTKAIDFPPATFPEITPSEIVPLKTSIAISDATKPQEHTWRHFTQNGYIRGSVDHQHLTLISDA